MGAKLFIGTPECETKVSLKINCSFSIEFWGSIHKNEYFCVDIVRLPLWSGYICIYNNIFLIAIYFWWEGGAGVC